MNMKSNIGKLFGVLVIGGSIISAASAEERKPCDIELRQKTNNPRKKVHITYLDEVDKDKTLTEILEENKPQECLTPFCGCWLG